MHSTTAESHTAEEVFDSTVEGLPASGTAETVRLFDGDAFDLTIRTVAKRIGDDVVRMMGYNGSVPGPCLIVDQGSEITVRVRNEGDIATTVHWHGLRVENRYDGVPGDTQVPIEIGGTYTYRVRFPDAGIYWYHPHLREDFAQEMGLYGTIVVRPSESSYWPPADQEMVLTLDDVLIEDGAMVPFRRSGPTFTAMGRFGNVMLVNGENSFKAHAEEQQVVRLYLVNTANTRIFNVALEGARMKLVGGDSGRYEHETFVDDVLLSPSERAVVDVLFDKPGPVRLVHREPDRLYDLGSFDVSPGVQGRAARDFGILRTDPDLSAERQHPSFDHRSGPDRVLAFVSSMPLLYGGSVEAGHYACPMHPEVTGSAEETCPKCGMRLAPVIHSDYECPMHPEVTGTAGETCSKCGMKLVEAAAARNREGAHPSPETHMSGHDHGPHGGLADDGQDDLDDASEPVSDGLEWEDLMPEINRATDMTNMIWKLIDRQTGKVNGAIDWSFFVGDRVKLRLINEVEGSDHPMHHPFHLHGAGRFLVLSRDGKPEDNLVWKDTVLVRAGEVVDVLLDLTNPGRWMAHCHIAEHAESGMMFSFSVDDPGPQRKDRQG